MPAVYSSVGWYCLIALVISCREDNGVKALASSAGWRTRWRQKRKRQAKKLGRRGLNLCIFISKVGIFPAVINLINCFCFLVHIHILYESTYDDGWMNTAMALWTEGPLTVLPSLASFLIPETKTCLSSLQWESLPVFMTSSAHHSHSGNLSILLLPTGTP